MGTAVVGTSNYPTLQTIADGVRALLNDSFAGATETPGEGLIITDNPTITPQMLPSMNIAIRTLFRKLRNAGDPELFVQATILNVPVVNGPQGSGVSDPTIQCIFTPSGFYDGSQVQAAYALPANCLHVVRMRERQAGSNDIFHDMVQPVEGLESVKQWIYNRQYEIKAGAIYVPGTIQPVDVQIRYKAAMPTFFGPNIDYKDTQIPILDCEEFVIYQTAQIIEYGLNGETPNTQSLQAKADDAMRDLKQSWVLRAQTKTFYRQEFEGDGAE